MSRPFVAVACAAAALLLAACSPSVQIAAERDPGADFRAYRDYAWLAAPRLAPDYSSEAADLLDWRVQTAVDGELRQRGYVRLPAGTPDLWVRYRIQLRETEVESFQDYYWYRRAGGSESPQDTFVFGYEEATLLVELLDVQTQRRIWRASAVAPRGAESKPERLTETVRLMFEQFPIPTPTPVAP